MIIKKTSLIIFSILQVALLNIPGVGDTPADKVFYDPSILEPRIIPADITFAIWAFIYPACFIYAIYFAFTKTDKQSLAYKVSDYALGAFVTISIYDVVARYKEISYLTAVIFFVALYFLVKAIFVFIDNKEVSKKDYYFTVPAISVYTLWSSLATIVNVSSSLLKLGYKGEPIGEVAWSIIGFILAIAVCSAMIFKTKNNWYYGASVWAFSGIILNGVMENFVDVIIGGIVALIITGLVFRHARKTSSV
jgi:hypothetical protein